MKRVLLISCVVGLTVTVFSQGTVVFNNHVTGSLNTYVYLGGWGTIWDDPPGTVDWGGFSKVSGSGYSAAIRAANGASVPESGLSFGVNPTVTSFRTGSAAGNFASTYATLSTVPKDAALATLQVFAWNNEGGTLMDPRVAFSRWQAGMLQAGISNPFTLANIGGDVNTPPFMDGLRSFNVIPEPGCMSLTMLCAAVLWFRRVQRHAGLRNAKPSLYES